MLDFEHAKGKQRAKNGQSPPSWENFRQRLAYEEQIDSEKREEARQRAPRDPAADGVDTALLLVGVPLLFLAAAIDHYWPNILEPSSTTIDYRWVAWVYHVLLAVPLSILQKIFALGSSMGGAVYASTAGWAAVVLSAISLLCAIVLIRRWTRLPIFRILIALYALPGIAALGWVGYIAFMSQ